MSLLQVLRRAIVCMVTLHSAALSTVYLNKIWDNETGRYVTTVLEVKGGSLTLDRGYQNQYGNDAHLPPGPPFIIEAPILITNITDENGNILKRGRLVFDNQFGGGIGTDPFEVLASAQPFGNDTPINIYGSFEALGTGMDPIVFRGTHFFSAGSGKTDASDCIRFKDCVFDIHPLTHSTPFSFYGPYQVTFEDCEFKAGSDTLSNLLYHGDPFRPVQETLRSSFSMSNCHFGTRTYRGLEVINLEDQREVTLQDIAISHQHFVTYTDPSLVGSLIRINNAGIRTIRRVTGSGNTIDCIRLRGCRACPVSVIADRGLPLEMTRGMSVPNGCTLSIGPESILKSDGIQVSGRLIVNRSLLTSKADDSAGGNTDVVSDPNGLNWTLDVRDEGYVGFLRTSMRYGQLATRGEGVIDSSQFLHADDVGIRILRTSSNGLTIRSSSVRLTRKKTLGIDAGAGISLRTSPQPIRVVLEQDTVTENAGHGIVIDLQTAPAFLSVDRSCISGNQTHGIYVVAGSAADSVMVTNSRILANRGAGISCADYGTTESLLRLEGNSILGNGSEAGWRPGATIAIARAQVVNNSFFWNTQHGLEIVPKDTIRSYSANNVFASNGVNGLKGNAPGRFLVGHNLFWNDRSGPVGYAFGDTYIGSLSQLRLLGGIYATNDAADPLFSPSTFGRVRAVAYDATSDQTLILTETPIGPPALAQWAVRLDTSRVGWFLIREASGDSVLVPGDVRTYTQVGRILQVACPSLTRSSPAIDAGNNLFPITSFDGDGDPRIADGNSDGIPIVDIGADEFNPASPGGRVARILAPSRGDVVVAGEPCVIRWSDAKTTSLNLSLRVRGVLRLNIVSGVPASNAGYTWTVPEDLLSAVCQIQLSDAVDTTWTTVSDTFRIKPLILTRYGPGGEYEPYRVVHDAWRFPNDSASMWPASWWNQFDYRGTDPFTQMPYPPIFADSAGLGARKQDFPDWPLFVRTFGIDQCYTGFAQFLLYRASALLLWQSAKMRWAGSCLGLAASSLLSFADKAAFLSAYPETGDFSSLHALTLTDDRREVINRLWTMQLAPAFKRLRSERRRLTPTETLVQLRRTFLSDSLDESYLVIERRIGGRITGAHAIVPFGIVRDPPDSTLFLIRVYENNVPSDSMTFVEVDSAAHTWAYRLFGLSDTVGLYLVDPIGNYASTPLLTMSPSPDSLAAFRKPIYEKRLSCYFPPGGTTRIYDSLGRVAGWPVPDGTPIPGAEPIVVATNPASAPLGYDLPDGQYRTELSGTDAGNVYLNLFSDGTAYGYSRKRLSIQETDEVTFGSDVVVHNPDDSPRECMIHAVAGGDSVEKAYRLTCMGIRRNDSLGVSLGTDERLDVCNCGGALAYGMTVTYGTPSAARIFQHTSIALPAHAVHHIEPSWEYLDSWPLRILVDLGSDGTIDDTLHLVNELAGTQGEGSVLPDEYRLEQNYPNPFNPSTTIRYQIPRSALVRLKVYDILGREVSVLVDERKDAGVYDVKFDASRLSSGVYVCRLQVRPLDSAIGQDSGSGAGNFVQARKMVVVR